MHKQAQSMQGCWHCIRMLSEHTIRIENWSQGGAVGHLRKKTGKERIQQYKGVVHLCRSCLTLLATVPTKVPKFAIKGFHVDREHEFIKEHQQESPCSHEVCNTRIKSAVQGFRAAMEHEGIADCHDGIPCSHEVCHEGGYAAMKHEGILGCHEGIPCSIIHDALRSYVPRPEQDTV
eukprot:1159662-Pelagomonas_calceolata.AAC.8